MRETGTYFVTDKLRYFIPYSLPPLNPPLVLTPEMMSLYGEASFALGKLNEMSLKLPDPKRFIKAYVIKEALLSSAIEGIHTTLIDVFTHPLGQSKPSKDTQLVLNYTEALDVALKMTQSEGLPLVSRVILKAHEALLSGGDGDKAHPGFYRKQSVRVGNLVPPPAPEIPRLMSELEHYINEPTEDMPMLIRAGLAHVQFETIHPFLDGNGRIGRLLIVLMLIQDGGLNMPILYPSYYFKKHHAEYYQRLDSVRTEGDFEGWVMYYLQAIKESALDAYVRAKEIEVLELQLKDTLQTEQRFSKMRETALLVLAGLFTQPIISISGMSEASGRSYNTVSALFKTFLEMGLISETESLQRSKLYRFDPYLVLLEKDYSKDETFFY